DPILPPFESADGRSEEDELTAQAEAGLRSRLQRHVYEDGMDEAAREMIAKPYFDRLAFELNVNKQMGFPGYFLIVADFIQWAR
ncbi:MAG TPA: hypothetical protein DEB58_01975, partial [Alphaproteobacteria bacterium]|nr:hypothetical protein [Alphaproteobacteria bacterium]